MPQGFIGRATIYGVPDRDLDVFTPGCFTEFLTNPAHQSVPMLSAHDPAQQIGHWLRMFDDGLGLIVIGILEAEMEEELLGMGLSIMPHKAQGPSHRNAFGGNLVRITEFSEISLVLMPANPACRVFGIL